MTMVSPRCPRDIKSYPVLYPGNFGGKNTYFSKGIFGEQITKVRLPKTILR